MPAKPKIPVYDICTLDKSLNNQKDFLAERFSEYLSRYYDHLHFPHRHSFYHMVLFTSGSGNHSIDFNQYQVKPFQLYAMIPGQVHSWNFDKNVEGYIINFSSSFFRSFLFNQEYLDRFEFFSGISDYSIQSIPIESREKISSLLNNLIQYNNATTESSLDIARSILIQLFNILQQLHPQWQRKPAPVQKYTLLRHFQQLIEKNYRSMKLPKEYADLLYITPNYLNALCQDLLGKSAGELIRERIILEGKRLLTNANMTITEIAYELNFQDNSYFTRFFKKQTEYTPEEFRKKFIINKI